MSFISRRRFIQTASSSALLGPYFLVRPAGAEGKAPPSERIVLGHIGTGGRGSGLINMFAREKGAQIVAVADVDRDHAERARKVVNQFNRNQDCVAYHDFRELLARDDIDAVVIATPDHWHALVAVAAARAGKHIYCEKPLANTIGESRAILDAIAAHDRLLQVGTHERSNPKIRFACELVRNGRIGEVRTVRVNLPCSDRHHKQAMQLAAIPPAEPVPDGFDYDFWLGHTPKVPYCRQRCHFWWRFNLAYGGGEMTDRGAHVIDIAQLGLGMDATAPVHINATGTRNPSSLYNAFFEYSFENVYANGVKLIGESKGQRGLKFEGSEGWVFVHIHGGRTETEPASLLEEKIGDDEIHLGRSPGHQRNFLDALRGQAPLMAPAEAGHHTASICHLNNIAMLIGRPLEWNPVDEQITNDETANRLLTPKMRPPWTLC